MLLRILFSVFMAASAPLCLGAISGYMDMESGTNRQPVNTNILNTATHGTDGFWSVNVPLTHFLVSTSFEASLPNPVTVDGVSYRDDQSTRSFVFTNTEYRQFVMYTFSQRTPKLSFGLYLRLSGFGRLDDSFDLVAVEAEGDFFVVNFQDRSSELAFRAHTLDDQGIGPGGPGVGVAIPIVQDKTYWITGLWDKQNLVATLRVYDPETWILVGVSTNVILNRNAENISIGRYDSHAEAIQNSSTYFDDLIWDVTGSIYPLLPASLGTEGGNRPAVTIDTPTNGATFRAGDMVTFSGRAFDVEDGTLPSSALKWNVQLRSGSYLYPLYGDWAATNRGSLLIPESGQPFGRDTRYELNLIATDSSGLQGASSVLINPELVNVSINSIPSGLTVKMD